MAKRLLVDGNTCAFLSDLDTKQDILTPGDNIKITDNTISVKVDIQGTISDEISKGATNSELVGFLAIASKYLQDKPLTKIAINVPATSDSRLKGDPFYMFLFQTEDSDKSTPNDPDVPTGGAPPSWGSYIARSKNGVSVARNTESVAEFEFDPIVLDPAKKLIITLIMQPTFSSNKLEGFPCKHVFDSADEYSGTYWWPEHGSRLLYRCCR